MSQNAMRRRCTTTVLILMALAGCGDGSDHHGSQTPTLTTPPVTSTIAPPATPTDALPEVTVTPDASLTPEETVTPEATATPDVSPTVARGEGSVAAGSQVAISIINLGKASVGQGGAAALKAREPAGIAVETVAPCTQDADIDFICSEENGTFTGTSFFNATPRGSGCLPGADPFTSSEIFLTSVGEQTCEGTLRDDVPVTCGFRNSLIYLGDSTDAVLIDYTTSFVPRSSGCASLDSLFLFVPFFASCGGASGSNATGTLTLDLVRSDLEVNAGAVVKDVVGRVRGLNLELDSSGVPCVVTGILSGEVETDDRVRGERIVATYDRFRVTETPLSGGGALIAETGTIATDCLGDIGVETLEPLRFDSREYDCPSAGLLQITVGGSTGTARYTAEGVEVDENGDGQPERTFANCRDASMACATPPPPSLCQACAVTDECSAGLDCLPCSFECTGSTRRCVGLDDLAACQDGIY